MIAVMTPMANPTVEQELRRLLPADLPWVTGRLVAKLDDAMARLRVYAESLAASLDQFGGMRIASVAFACTGSSYLLGPAREQSIAQDVGLPVIWATSAILAELRSRGVRRIALVSPYPDDLHEAGLAYWAEQGLDVIHAMRIEIGTRDTRAIYGLAETVARPAVVDALARKPDAVLISGTGLPTLGLILPDAPIPVLSSNQCLAVAIRKGAAAESPA